jgi:hypothetical protein
MGIVELLKIYRCDIIGRKTRIFWMDEHWNVLSTGSDIGAYLYTGPFEEHAVAALFYNEER